MFSVAHHTGRPTSLPGTAHFLPSLAKRVAVIAVAVATSSCATVGSQYVNSGRVVHSAYAIDERLITYEAENKEIEPTYHLIRDQGKLAILEESEGSFNVIINHNRVTDAGDHFVIWIKGAIFGTPGPAGEIIIPPDRTQPAEYYWYAAGT